MAGGAHKSVVALNADPQQKAQALVHLQFFRSRQTFLTGIKLFYIFVSRWSATLHFLDGWSTEQQNTYILQEKKQYKVKPLIFFIRKYPS